MTAILAHGMTVRADLPIPVSTARYAAIAVIAFTFICAMKLWRRPKFETGGGITVARLKRFVDSTIVAITLRIAGAGGLVLTLAMLLLDTNDATPNAGTTWFYVWFWVGLVPASLLLGPVWRRVDPLPLLSAALRRALRRTPRDVHEYPVAWGMWPAAIGLFAFVWLELVAPEGSTPESVARFIIVYGLASVMMGSLYGPVWFEKAAAFSTYSDLLARMSPWMRDVEGRLTLVNPLRNLASIRHTPGLFPVVAVILGSTAFDGLSRTVPWIRWTTDMDEAQVMVLGTAGLIATIAVVTVVFRTSMQLTGSRRSDAQPALHTSFAGSLIPIAAGYAIAHYFSLFVFQGQAGFILLNDPFDRNWNLFGSAQSPIDYEVVSSSLIGWVQVSAIVVGHVIGVLAAHEQATRTFTASARARAQLPLLVVMLAFTFGGIGLLLGA